MCVHLSSVTVNICSVYHDITCSMSRVSCVQKFNVPVIKRTTERCCISFYFEQIQVQNLVVILFIVTSDLSALIQHCVCDSFITWRHRALCCSKNQEVIQPFLTNNTAQKTHKNHSIWIYSHHLF